MASPATILCCIACSAKNLMTGPIHCPDCGNGQLITRHGFYMRYLPDSVELVKVQRFRCRNQRCSRVTFSILPYPCLRYKRHTLETFGRIAGIAKALSIRRLAQKFSTSWTTMQRLVSDSLRVWRCFAKERNRLSWGPCPCTKVETSWTSFTTDLYRLTSPVLG